MKCTEVLKIVEKRLNGVLDVAVLFSVELMVSVAGSCYR